MSSTPIWLTLLVGILGPLATVSAVLLTGRQALRRFLLEQDAARAKALNERRTAFELEKLSVVEAELLELSRIANKIIRLYETEPDRLESHLNETHRDDLELIHAKLTRAAGVLRDRKMRKMVVEAADRYSEAIGRNDAGFLVGGLVIANEKAKPVSILIASRVLSLHNEAETEYESDPRLRP